MFLLMFLDYRYKSKPENFGNIAMASNTAVVSSSPKILSISWGKIAPEFLPEGKDYKLYPGGGRLWDWTEDGTRHRPGITEASVKEIVDKGATTVVLSRGMDEVLQVPAATVKGLEDIGIKVYVEQSAEAAEVYNRLVEEGVAVGGLFHSTC